VIDTNAAIVDWQCVSQATNAEGCRTKKQVIMKEFLKIMGKDIMTENFTRKEFVIFGIVAPLVLVLVCGLAGSLA